MGQLSVMGREGDTRVTWDVDNFEEVKNARRTFDDLRKKGYWAYEVEEGGKGNLITKFDPGVEKMILAPQMAGGANA